MAAGKPRSSVLWIFGAVVAVSLAVIGAERFAVCGAGVTAPPCDTLFAPAVPRAMWYAYFAVGFAAAALAVSKALQQDGTRRAKPAVWFAWIFPGAAVVYCLSMIVLRASYYLVGFAVVHWLLIRWFQTGRRPGAGAGEFLIILVSWVVASTLAGDQPLDRWLFGSLQTPQGWFACAIFAASLIAIAYAFDTAPSADSHPTGAFGATIDCLWLAVFATVSFRQDFFGEIGSRHHWSFFVGPAELVRQGGWLLWDVPSQYGFLSTLAIAAMPFRSVWTSMYVLDAVLIFASASILYFTLRALRLGRFSLLVSGTATLVCVFLMPGAYPGLTGPQYFPSVGALRFIWVESILLVLLLDYANRRRRSVIATAVAGSLVWIAGVLWSAESAIYVSVIWLPSLFALTLLRDDGATVRERLRSLTRQRNLLALGMPLIFLLVAVVSIQLTYTIALGHGPDYFAYYEFGLSYGRGFGVYPIYALGAVWMLVLAFAVCASAVVTAIASRRAAFRALPILYASTATVWVTASYFVSRSADSNVTNVFTPLWLALAIVLFALGREGSLEAEEWRVRLALSAPLVVAITLTLGNQLGMQALIQKLRGGYSANIPGLMATFPPNAVALLDRAGVTSRSPLVYDGDTVAPEWPGAGPDSVPGPLWLPANPTIMLTVIPEARKLTYFSRFTARRPMPGWYLRARSPTNTCENLDPQFVTGRSYETDDFDLSWCRPSDAGRVSRR